VQDMKTPKVEVSRPSPKAPWRLPSCCQICLVNGSRPPFFLAASCPSIDLNTSQNLVVIFKGKTPQKSKEFLVSILRTVSLDLRRIELSLGSLLWLFLATHAYGAVGVLALQSRRAQGNQRRGWPVSVPIARHFTHSRTTDETVS
jgi:hypothetical protein